MGIIPVYDHYSCMYAACDRFNRNMHDRKWPHKTGGKNKKGEEGLQNSFAWSCLLQNIFNAHDSIKKISNKSYEFESYCLKLSEELYEESCRIFS